MSEKDKRTADEKIEPATFRPRSVDDEHEVISAATFSRGASESAQLPGGRGSHVQAKIVWAAFAALIVIAAAVFWLLPRTVDDPHGETRQAVQVSRNPTPQPVVAATPVQPEEPAPWQTAQILRQKEAAEALTEQFVRLQMELEDAQVQLWGAQSFDQAIALAQEGDGQFSQRDFLGAAANYEQGLSLLQELQGGMGDIFDKAMAQGSQALLDYNSSGARESFELALVMEPNHPGAKKGLARSATLEQVARLADQASASERQGELESARDALEKAAALDRDDQVVSASLNRIKALLRDRQFDSLMSRGYANLDNGNAALAVKDFDQAGKIRPGSTEVKDALAQAESMRRLDRIAQLQTEAARLENSENWNSAAEQYETALGLDGSLVFAREGAQRAKERAALDDRMRSYIQQPERLQADAVYQAAEQVLQIAKSIEPRAQILGQQITALEKALVQSRQPVQVRFQSDNETRVILGKVGPLGIFTEKEVALRPGTYVATGSRNGYRDVRKTFVVSPGSENVLVLVRCEEKI